MTLYRLDQSTDYTRECLSDTRHEISGFFDVVATGYEAAGKQAFRDYGAHEGTDWEERCQRCIEAVEHLEYHDAIDYEAAAAAEHDQWMRWAQTLMDTEQLSQDRIDRWMPYMVPYSELPDDVQEYDRIEARLLLDAALGQDT